MKQNVISLNTLFKYYRTVQRECIEQIKEKPLVIITFRAFRKYQNEWNVNDFVDSIDYYLQHLKYPTARTEKIRKILGL